MLYALFAPTKPRKKVVFHRPVTTEVSPEPEHAPSPEDDSDISSTCADAGTDEELDELTATAENKRKMSTTDASSDATPEWTREEDRILCVRKSEAKSWTEIGKELERGKKECQQRYRAISSHARELGITTEMLAKLYLDEEESRSKKTGKDKSTKSKDDEEDSYRSKSKSKGPGRDKTGKAKKAKQGDDDNNNNTKSDGKPDAKSKKGNKKKKGASAPSEPSSPSDADADANADADSEDKEGQEKEEKKEPEDPEADYWAQRRYIYDTMFGGLYQDQKMLRPDRFYSESDCRVLAGLEARYRANKWLYIQADFCNATGRMVEAEMLKAKFYEDEYLM